MNVIDDEISIMEACPKIDIAMFVKKLILQKNVTDYADIRRKTMEIKIFYNL